MSTGHETTLARKVWLLVASLAWLPDGSGLVAAVTPELMRDFQLLHIAYPSGKVRRITNDLNSYLGVSLTDDGRALATTQLQRTATIWIQDGNGTDKARKVSTTGMNRDGLWGMAWAADGRIIFSSSESGHFDIWAMQPDGGNRRPLTANEDVNVFPTAPWSSGKQIVFVAATREGPNIWRMDNDGRNVQQLTFGNIDLRPAVSPDGRWIIYETRATAKAGLMKVSIDGGEPVRVLEQQARSPAISPDGKWLAFRFQSEGSGAWLTGVMPFEGGEVAYVFENQENPVGWSPDSKGICFARNNEEGGQDLWLQPLDGGEPTRVTDFEGDEDIPGFAWEPGGKRLAVVRGKTIRDAVLIRNFR